jgi:uncharacterized protein
MKIVISPAKSLDFETVLPISTYTQSDLLNYSEQVQSYAKQLSPRELSDLMKISDKLAELNWQRNQEWSLPFTPENARPAVFAFNGDVYTGLDAYTIPTDKFEVLQNKLRILSGLYGVLKPLDLIQPYRLEMGIKLAVGDKANLVQFWKEIITNKLNEQLQDNELFVNLASTEYFSSVDVKKLKVPVITPEFKDYKDGKLKIISFFAKKARGLMVRYIIDNNIETIDELKGFNYEGYAFDANLSDDKNLIFTR